MEKKPREKFTIKEGDSGNLELGKVEERTQ